MQLTDTKLFRQQGYVDGAWIAADSGKTVAVTDPATSEELGTVPNMGADETRRAIEAANAALPGWRARTAKERANILRKWFELMMANQEDLARLMTAEQGKPLTEFGARSPMPPRSSNGSPKRASASTATRSRLMAPTSVSSC